MSKVDIKKVTLGEVLTAKEFKELSEASNDFVVTHHTISMNIHIIQNQIKVNRDKIDEMTKKNEILLKYIDIVQDRDIFIT